MPLVELSPADVSFLRKLMEILGKPTDAQIRISPVSVELRNTSMKLKSPKGDANVSIDTDPQNVLDVYKQFCSAPYEKTSPRVTSIIIKWDLDDVYVSFDGFSVQGYIKKLTRRVKKLLNELKDVIFECAVAELKPMYYSSSPPPQNSTIEFT